MELTASPVLAATLAHRSIAARFSCINCNEHRDQPTALSNDVLGRVGQLYAIEASIRGKPLDVRARARQEHGRPVVDALRAIIDDACRKLSPKPDVARRSAMA